MFDRISILRGEDGENGASRERRLCALLLSESGSSGIVSLDIGRVILAAPRAAALARDVAPSVEAVDTVVREDGRDDVVKGAAGRVRAEEVELAVVLAVLGRDNKVEGLLGGADAAPLLLPNVVRRVVAAVLSSAFAVLELKEAVGVLALDKRLFSSFVAASSANFVVDLRTAEETGRVGGLVMEEPFARIDSALVRLVEGVERRSATDIFFFASSPGVGLAEPVVGGLLALLSIFPLRCSTLRSSWLLVTAFAVRREAVQCSCNRFNAMWLLKKTRSCLAMVGVESTLDYMVGEPGKLESG